MRARERRRPQQQQQTTLPTTSQQHETPMRRRRRRESTSPIVILTVVMIGACLVFLVVSKLVKASNRRAANQHQEPPSNTVKENNFKQVDSRNVENEMPEQEAPVIKEEPPVEDQPGEEDNADGRPAGAKVGNDDDITKDGATDSPTASPEKSEKVLALLYPPGLMGGYRNQVIRILSLVLMAAKKKIPNLLLPSLMWMTQVIVEDGTEKWVPIPHDLVFDVEHWNTFTKSMPRLVNESLTKLDCWTHDYAPPPSNATLLTKEVLSRGFSTPIANLSRSLATREYVTNLRKLDVLHNITDDASCTNPTFYGGGMGAGRLWRDYINTQKKGSDFHGADAELLKALRPKQEWRDLAQSCTSSAKYVALHARMELEMMDHACGRAMERNLTQLFHHVEDFVGTMQDVQSVFVAVSRSGIELTEGNLYEKYKTYADENLNTLNRVVGKGDDVGQGLSDGNTAVFECGKHLMDQYYKDHPGSIDYGSLLQSVVNFYIATEAKAFIGVRGSSYSTDIWTTRYHQGNGATNYEYTKEGIVQLPNGGKPPMHTNCGKKK